MKHVNLLLLVTSESVQMIEHGVIATADEFLSGQLDEQILKHWDQEELEEYKTHPKITNHGCSVYVAGNEIGHLYSFDQSGMGDDGDVVITGETEEQVWENCSFIPWRDGPEEFIANLKTKLNGERNVERWID